MSGTKCEVRPVPVPVITYEERQEVAAWPLTSLRALALALERMDYKLEGKQSELLALSRADSRFAQALNEVKSNSRHGSLQQTEDTVGLIEEVEAAAEALKAVQKAADAARPSIITVTSPKGRLYNLAYVAGSYQVEYSEVETYSDGRLDSVKRDEVAREFVHRLTHAYCSAEDEHKENLSDESVVLDEISEDLKSRLRKARRNMDQWQRVKEVSRIRDLIRERRDFIRSEAESMGHETSEYDLEDEVVVIIHDSGPKLHEMREDEERIQVGGG